MNEWIVIQNQLLIRYTRLTISLLPYIFLTYRFICNTYVCI